MHRDDDLIRKLMLALEEASSRITDRYEVKGYTRDQIAYHLGLIVRAGYAEGPGPRYSSTGSDPTIPSVVILDRLRSEEHTSELQSLMRISYAVFCLKKKN